MPNLYDTSSEFPCAALCWLLKVSWAGVSVEAATTAVVALAAMAVEIVCAATAVAQIEAFVAVIAG